MNVQWPPTLLALPPASVVPLPANTPPITIPPPPTPLTTPTSLPPAALSPATLTLLTTPATCLFAGLRLAMGLHAVSISDRALTILASAFDATSSSSSSSSSATSTSASAAASSDAKSKEDKHREERAREREERSRRDKTKAVDALLHALRLSGLLCQAADAGQVFCTVEVSDGWNAAAPKEPKPEPAKPTPGSAAATAAAASGSAAAASTSTSAAASSATPSASLAAGGASTLRETKEAKELRVEKERRATVTFSSVPVAAPNFRGYPAAVLVHELCPTELQARLPSFKPNFNVS